MRVSLRWPVVLLVVVAMAWLTAGCGGDGDGEGAGRDTAGKTQVTGSVAVREIMGVTFVPVVGGKADTSKAEPVGVVDGKYETWVAPGKYQLCVMDHEGKPGAKIKDVDVGATKMTVDVTEMPKSK